MHSNKNASECEDHYCDSMQVCGVACSEIDVQEANAHAWLSTLHLRDDAAGASGGFGGDFGKPDFRDWDKAHYGPDGKCINTSKPFDVQVSFPTDVAGRLRGMEVTLRQRGNPCEVSTIVDQYLPRSGHDAYTQLTEVLESGVTPVMSYWSSTYMAWLDGPGKDKEGPCEKGSDLPEKCSKSVKFSNFRVSEAKRSEVNLHLNRL
jgi:hypothetical protein